MPVYEGAAMPAGATMSTILEGLTKALSSSATRDIAKAVGLKPELVTQGMAVVGPLIATALANKASTAGGAVDLMQLLPKGGTSSLLGNPANPVDGGTGDTAVSSILGSGAGAIGATLDRALGFKASSLLGFAAPLVLGLIGKIAGEKKLDPAGLAQLLAGDAADFEKTGSETARLVRLAVDAGHQAAHVKAKYTPVQWERVRLAPVAAAYVVMMADKSGPVGAMKEMRAANGAIDDAKKVASPTSVLSLAFDSDFSVEELSKFARGRTNADALRTVREAMEVVTRNSPADVSTYRRLVADVASQVASASREGGVLRFGGTHASASERAALDQLRSVIGDRYGR